MSFLVGPVGKMCTVSFIEEVEYPDGEEALPQEAEDLIRKLLEKSSTLRLGSGSLEIFRVAPNALGAPNGATEVMGHPFFKGLDFTSLLREKAEFVPQLENDEDTSYFDSKTIPTVASRRMFSPSRTLQPRRRLERGRGLRPDVPLLLHRQSSPFHHLPRPPAVHPIPGSVPLIPYQCLVQPTPATSVSPLDNRSRKPSTATQSSEDQGTDSADLTLEGPSASAVLLRRRFSAQRQANISTSSSGTTGTGCINTAGSSTDSSMDASHISTVIIPDLQGTKWDSFGYLSNHSIKIHPSPICHQL